jgi:hypothetical protein
MASPPTFGTLLVNFQLDEIRNAKVEIASLTGCYAIEWKCTSLAMT